MYNTLRDGSAYSETGGSVCTEMPGSLSAETGGSAYSEMGGSVWTDIFNYASRGQGQPNLNTNIIRELLFALPPLEEQHHIVQRIEELFAICDRFKVQLEQRQAVNERLVKGLVAEVLEGS